MGFKWGRIALIGLTLAGLGILLAGCTLTQDVAQGNDRITKTILVRLPERLPEGVTALQWSSLTGDFTYRSGPERRAQITISAPQSLGDQVETVEFSWVEEDGLLKLVTEAGELDFSQAQVRFDLSLTYPSQELPKGLEIDLGVGKAELTGFRGRLDLKVAGTCLLEDVQLADGSQIRAGGWIRGDLASLDPGLVSIEADFGFIELNLPRDSGVKVVAETEMGEIINNLPFSFLEPPASDDFGARLSGWLNAGASELRVYCRSGDIYLYPRQSRNET